MPLYVYRCIDCGEKYERIVPMNDKAPVICSKCGGDSVKVFDESSLFAAHGLPNGFASTNKG